MQKKISFKKIFPYRLTEFCEESKKTKFSTGNNVKKSSSGTFSGEGQCTEMGEFKAHLKNLLKQWFYFTKKPFFMFFPKKLFSIFFKTPL